MASQRDGQAPGHDRRTPLWVLALLTLSGTAALHIFVPAIPLVTEEFAGEAIAAHWTLTIYIIGLGIGQLLHGPASEIFGRRRVLLAGMALYTLAGLCSMLAPTIGVLVLSRFLQALGGCAGLILGRAIARDDAWQSDAVRSLSLLNLLVVLGPGIAPLAGSLLASTGGWRSIPAALVLLGLVNFSFVWWLLPAPQKGNRPVAAGVLRNGGLLLRSRRFVLLALAGSCATTSIYAYVASAPTILMEFARPAHEVGWYLFVSVLGIWLGSLIASIVANRIRQHLMAMLAAALLVGASGLIVALVLFGTTSVFVVAGSAFCFSLGVGIISPTLLSEALSVKPGMSGTASGLYGSMQMGVGALCTYLVGINGNTTLATGAVMLGAALVAAVCVWLLRPGRR